MCLAPSPTILSTDEVGSVAPPIFTSVGQDAVNGPGDVFVIQSLLNKRLPQPHTEVPVTGVMDPGTILAAIVVPFVPETDPLVQPRGGIADFRLHLPNVSWVLGTQLATQWFELSQMASSNTWLWSVANAAPTLDMALVEGHPSEAKGEVSVHLAHVLRLEYQ